MADQQGKTLADAMEQAATEVDAQAAKVESTETGSSAVPEEKPWEGPAYTKMWKEPGRKALEKLAKHPELAEDYKHLIPELDNVYNYAGRTNQELSHYRKRFEPVSDLLGQAEQAFTLRGQSLQQGLSQLFAAQAQLEQNPDQMFPYIGQMYKPSNPAGVLQALSQAWGADLGQVAQEQPYIDPAIQSLVMPMYNRLNEVQQELWNRQQQEKQQQFDDVIRHITAFETEKDEHGPKHPFFRDVYNDLVMLIQMGRANGLADAYEMATRYHPAAQEAKAKQAEQKALQEASRTSAATKQASEASRNINGSGKASRAPGMLTQREAMELADKQLSNR